MTTAEHALDIARAELGYQEGWSGGHWNNKNKFGAAYGASGEPWCAWFVRWVLSHAGVPIGAIPTSGSCTANMNWAKANGRWHPGIKGIRPGDVVIFNGVPGGTPKHTGLLESATSSTVTTIDGNTNTSGSPEGNAVLRKTRPANRVIGYIRPDYDQEAPVSTPSVGTTDIGHWAEGKAELIDLTKDGKPVSVKAGDYRVLGRIVLPEGGRFDLSAAIRLPAGCWARWRWARIGWGTDPDGHDETGCNLLPPAPDGLATSYTPRSHPMAGGGPVEAEIKVYGAATAALPVVKLMATRIA